MKISILDETYIKPDKGGYPVYIKGVIDINSLEELAFVCQSEHIAISTFDNNYRCGDNWISSDFLSIDFDDGKVSALELHEFLKFIKLNHVIIASKNHLKDKGDGAGVIERFHVFIPFSKTIKDDVTLYRYIAQDFIKRFKRRGWFVDEGVTKDKCRYYFKHRETLFLYENNNEANNIDIALLTTNKTSFDNLTRRLELKEKNKRPVDQNSIETFRKTNAYKTLVSDMNGDGRYYKSNSIIGTMIKCGLNKYDALALFDQYASYGTGFTRKSVEQRYDRWA